MRSEQRIDWIDRLKGVLIILVVLGHAVGAVLNEPRIPYSMTGRTVFKYIYLFHMPAFFFLAGLTLRQFRFVSKVRRLLVPYYLFGVLSIVVYWIALRGHISGAWWHAPLSVLYGAPYPGTDGFRCNSALWFLPCLLVTCFIAALLFKACDGRRCGALLEAGVGVLCIPAYVTINVVGCPSLPYGLGLMLKYLPYVIAAHLMSGALVRERGEFERRTRWMLASALAIYLCGVYFAPFDWGMYQSYWKCAVVSLFGLAGSCGICWAAYKIRFRALASIGELSLGIMLVHKWFVLALNRVGCYNVLVVTVVAMAGSVLLTRSVLHFAPWALGSKK